MSFPTAPLETGAPQQGQKHGPYSSHGGFVWNFTRQLQETDFLVCVLFGEFASRVSLSQLGTAAPDIPQPSRATQHSLCSCTATSQCSPTPLPGAKSSLFKDPALGSPHPILWQNKPWMSLTFLQGTQRFLEKLASNVLFLNNHAENRVGEPRLAGLVIHLLVGPPKTKDADAQALLRVILATST